MICYYTNDSIFRPERLDKGWYHFKKQSCGQRNSNLAFFSAKKRCIAGGIILVSTDILVRVLVSLLVPLGIIFIFVIKLKFTDMQFI